MAGRNRVEEEVSHTEATAGIPIIGETIYQGGHLYRCISIEYADHQTTGREPELRIRYRQEASDRPSPLPSAGSGQ